MYPVAPYLAQQTHTVPVQHSSTSGEVEWALIIADDGRQLLTPPPTCSARTPWVLSEISDHLDQITLRSWVTNGGVEEEIQTGSLADLLPPGLWVEVLKERRNFARDDRAVGDLEHARGCEPVRRSLARRHERSGHRRHHQHRLRRRADGQADQLTAR